jgi:hypothetical protein
MKNCVRLADDSLQVRKAAEALCPREHGRGCLGRSLGGRDTCFIVIAFVPG